MTRLKGITVAIFLCTMFSCDSKKTDKEIQAKPTDNIVGSTLDNINNSEHSIVQFQIDGEVCFATINQYFKDFKNKNSFPLSLWVTVETLEKNDKGHPVDSEATLFNNLEDSLILKFVSKTPFCYIGRTTRDGYRELMFYVVNKEKATEIMNTFIRENIFKRRLSLPSTPILHGKAWAGY